MAKRLALLIGNRTFADAESFGDLRTPINDAKDFASVLDLYCGFEVLGILEDADADAIRRAIDDLFNRAQRGELTLLYYSGHGYKGRDGKHYLIATNTQANRLLSTGIQDSWIHMAMSQSLSRHRVVILDCCFSGAFIEGGKKSGTEQLSLEVLKGESTAILASSGRIQYSFEEAGRNSLFTQYLLEGIRTGQVDKREVGSFSIGELFYFAESRVKRYRPDQTPMIELSVRESEITIPLPLKEIDSDRREERRAADHLIRQLARANGFNTLGKLARMLIILDDEIAVEPLAQLRERLIPDYPQSYAESNYSLWQEIESWVQEKRLQPPEFIKIAVRAQVLNENGKPTTTISMDENWTLRTEWDVPLLEHRIIGGSWELSAILESFGPGPEFSLGPESISLPEISSFDSPKCIKDIHLPPGYVSAGAYKIVTVVMVQDEEGNPATVGGFYELPQVILFREKTPDDTPDSYVIPVQAEVRDESGQRDSIFSVQDTWSVLVEWETATLQKGLSGNWRISLFLLPIGPGPEFKLPQEPRLVPVTPGLQSAAYAEEILIEAGDVAAGLYNVHAAVEHVSEDGEPTNLAGFFEGPVVQIFQDNI